MPAAVAELEFRAAGPADEPALDELFVAARPALALTGLDAAGQRQLLQLQRHGQQLSYSARWPHHRTEVICRSGAVLGMITTAEDYACVHVLDVAVSPMARGDGIGTAALTRVIDATRKPVDLTVAIGNPAQRLYSRLGFVEIGRSDTDVLLRRPTEGGPAT